MGLNRLDPYGAAPLLSSYALRLGLACGYGLHLGVVFCGLAADLFWTAVFVYKHGKFLIHKRCWRSSLGDSRVAQSTLR